MQPDSSTRELPGERVAAEPQTQNPAGGPAGAEGDGALLEGLQSPSSAYFDPSPSGGDGPQFFPSLPPASAGPSSSEKAAARTRSEQRPEPFPPGPLHGLTPLEPQPPAPTPSERLAKPAAPCGGERRPKAAHKVVKMQPGIKEPPAAHAYPVPRVEHAVAPRGMVFFPFPWTTTPFPVLPPGSPAAAQTSATRWTPGEAPPRPQATAEPVFAEAGGPTWLWQTAQGLGRLRDTTRSAEPPAEGKVSFPPGCFTTPESLAFRATWRTAPAHEYPQPETTEWIGGAPRAPGQPTQALLESVAASSQEQLPTRVMVDLSVLQRRVHRGHGGGLRGQLPTRPRRR